MSKYTIGIKFQKDPYIGYSEVRVDSLNQEIWFPLSKSSSIATGVIINGKLFKYECPVYIGISDQPFFKKGQLYKCVKESFYDKQRKSIKMV